MAKAKVIMDFSANRYPDSEFKVKCDTVIADLTNNVNFPTLADKALAIKKENDNFAGLLARMPEGNKQVTLAKNQSRMALVDLMGSTALQVQDISNGDEQLILSAGFDVRRKSAPVGELERIETVIAKPGSSRGSLEISWDVIPNAYMYEIEYCESPNSPDSKWIRLSTTKHKIIIDGLIRGKAYAIRVAAAGSDPKRVWSDEIVSYVM